MNALLLADRQLDRNRPCGCSDSRSDCERALEAGALAIEPVEHDEPRQAELVGRLPRPSRSAPSTPATASTTTSGGVGDVQRRARVAEEVADARRVDQVDLLLVPLGVGEAGRQRVLAGDLLLVEIGDGRAVVDLAEAVDHAGVGENGRGELRFAGAAVSDERDIPDAGGVVDLHRRRSPSAEAIWSMGASYCGAVAPAAQP